MKKTIASFLASSFLLGGLTFITPSVSFAVNSVSAAAHLKNVNKVKKAKKQKSKKVSVRKRNSRKLRTAFLDNQAVYEAQLSGIIGAEMKGMKDQRVEQRQLQKTQREQMKDQRVEQRQLQKTQREQMKDQRVEQKP